MHTFFNAKNGEGKTCRIKQPNGGKMNSLLYILLQLMGSGNADSTLSCVFTQTPITIDARLNEKDWQRAVPVILTDRIRRKSKNQAIVRTLWDLQNLYLFFQVRDKNLQALQRVRDHPLLAQDDMVEFLIDTRNKKDSCWNTDDVVYHINILGQKKDDRGRGQCITNPAWNGNAHFAVRLQGSLNDSTDTDTGFEVEVSISWKELDLSHIPDCRWELILRTATMAGCTTGPALHLSGPPMLSEI
jgi:hypothetical protein